MIIEYSGPLAISALCEEKLVQTWDILYQQSTWATAFQDRRYVQSWYELYYPEYNPLLIIQKADNEITGILPLVITPDGEIVGAGHHQGEYQSWLCAEEIRISFFSNAIKWVRDKYPTSKIFIRFTPHLMPVEDLLEDSYLNKILHLEPCPLPVMKIDEEFITKKLKKSDRTTKMNKLKKIGELKFERIEKFEEYEVIINDLIDEHDFRKGAVYGTEFFAMDKMKKSLMLRLFQEGLLHVTLFKVNHEILASHSLVYGKGVIYNQGFNTHSPVYSKYSTGILGLLKLGLHLNTEHMRELDLTPGGTDGYKTELATDFYNTFELHIVSEKEKKKLEAVSKLRNLVKARKAAQSRATTTPVERLKEKIAELRETSVTFFKRGARQYNRQKTLLEEPQKNVVLYEVSKPAGQSDHILSGNVRKNLLRDFLLFSDKEAIIKRQKYLYDVMKRLEYGHQAYTLVEGDRLMACLWYIPGGTRIDHPVLDKSEVSYVFLAVYSDMEVEKLKDLVTPALLNIFNEQEVAESITFRINKGSFALNQIADQRVLTCKQMN